MAKYRKKPVIIEARQLTKDVGERINLALWCGGEINHDPKPSDPTDVRITIRIPTLEGVMTADIGDWIIKGVQGEFYPCKPDIFEATYEPAETVPNRHETPDVAELRRLLEELDDDRS